MNRVSIGILVTLFGLATGYSQQAVELHLAGGTDGEQSLHAPIFSDTGDHLFSLANSSRIRVHQTSDGALVREFDLPNNALRDKSAKDVSLVEFAGRLSFTSDDKQLVIKGPSRVTWLIDTDALVAGQDVTPTVIRTPEKAANFVCSLENNRLIFVAGESKGTTDHLLVYDLDRKSFDSGATVELNAIAPIDPNYLAMHQMFNPYVYLLGTGEDGDFLALRVTPAKGHTSMLVPQSCLIEKLRIRWDQRGYSTMDVVDRGKLPFLPTAVSPTLSHYLCSRWIQRSPSECTVTIGLERIAATTHRPTPLRRLACGVMRAIGYRDGIWSADGQLLLVGDGCDTERRRPTAISFHEPGGRQLGFIPTGEAHSANVLAVSGDGRFVVTHRELRLSSSTTSDRKKRDDKHEYQVWELK